MAACMHAHIIYSSSWTSIIIITLLFFPADDSILAMVMLPYLLPDARCYSSPNHDNILMRYDKRACERVTLYLYMYRGGVRKLCGQVEFWTQQAGGLDTQTYAMV